MLCRLYLSCYTTRLMQPHSAVDFEFVDFARLLLACPSTEIVSERAKLPQPASISAAYHKYLPIHDTHRHTHTHVLARATKHLLGREKQK